MSKEVRTEPAEGEGDGGGAVLNGQDVAAAGRVRLVRVLSSHQISGAIHDPTTRLERLGGPGLENHLGAAVAVYDVDEMIHHHLAQPLGDGVVLRFRQYSELKVPGLRRQPGSIGVAVPLHDLDLVGAVEPSGHLREDRTEGVALPPSTQPAREGAITAGEERPRSRHQVDLPPGVPRNQRVGSVHAGLSTADNPHRRVAGPHLRSPHVAVVRRDRTCARTGQSERLVGLDPLPVGLDQPIGLDLHRATVARSAGDTYCPPILLGVLELVAEEFGDLDTPLYDLQAVLQMVEDLILGREVLRLPIESPLDVPSGEERMRLVEPEVVVGIQPHAAHAVTAVNQDNPVVARQVLAGNEQRIKAGNPGSHNAHVAPFGMRAGRIPHALLQ